MCLAVSSSINIGPNPAKFAKDVLFIVINIIMDRNRQFDGLFFCSIFESPVLVGGTAEQTETPHIYSKFIQKNFYKVSAR